MEQFFGSEWLLLVDIGLLGAAVPESDGPWEWRTGIVTGGLESLSIKIGWNLTRFWQKQFCTDFSETSCIRRRKLLIRLATLHLLIRPYCSICSDRWCNRKLLKRQKSEDVARTTILPLLIRPMTCLCPTMNTGLAPPLVTACRNHKIIHC